MVPQSAFLKAFLAFIKPFEVRQVIIFLIRDRDGKGQDVLEKSLLNRKKPLLPAI